MNSRSQLQAHLYNEDRMHLHDLGYWIWSASIESHLDAVRDADGDADRVPES